MCRAVAIYVGAVSSPSSINDAVTSDDDLIFYLSVYGGLAGANSLLTLLRAFLFAYGGIKAAVVLHSQLLAAILKVISFRVHSAHSVSNIFCASAVVVKQCQRHTLCPSICE